MRAVNPTTLAAWIAAGAALLAAGVSLVGVGMTARLSKGSKREEWRRDYILPIVGDILTLQEETVRALYPNLIMRAPRLEQISSEFNGMLGDMLTRVAALQLTASIAVYDAARGVLIGCEKEIEGSPGKDHPEYDFLTTRATLVDATRRDLGLPD
jgi:hypothetical protein